MGDQLQIKTDKRKSKTIIKKCQIKNRVEILQNQSVNIIRYESIWTLIKRTPKTSAQSSSDVVVAAPAVVSAAAAIAVLVVSDAAAIAVFVIAAAAIAVFVAVVVAAAAALHCDEHDNLSNDLPSHYNGRSISAQLYS